LRKRSPFALDTLIGANTIFEGSIYSERSVCVEGTVRGKIEAKGEVMVGRRGRVEADVLAESVVVGGHIIGTVRAEKRLEITATGRVSGNIEAGRIAVADGGVLEGFCRMLGREEVQCPQLEQRLAIEEGQCGEEPCVAEPIKDAEQM